MTTTLTLDAPTTTGLVPNVHVIRWHSRTDGRHYVLVGLVTGEPTGDYADLTHVLKFDVLTAEIVARFDRLDEVARTGAVPGYRIPLDAEWWRDRWVRCQREHIVAAVERHLSLLHRLDDLARLDDLS